MIKFSEFKKFFIFNLIGSLVISAIVAVITVLLGNFNEVAFKVLITLTMVVSHSLVSLGFIWDDERQNTFDRLAYFSDVLFVLIVSSFVTSIFGVWSLISSELVWHLYQTFFVIGFASLHGDILSKVLGKETYIDTIVYINYFFMAVLVLLLLPAIFITDSAKILGEMYFRIMGAVGIIDGTLSVLTIIFYKLYILKHPQTQNLLSGAAESAPVAQKRGLSVWVWILIFYLAIQIISSLMFGVFSRLSL